MSLIVSNLSKKYGSKTVLDRLSFEMSKSGVYALLGTNGAGKTTAIRMMLGMLAKDSGEVLWNGKPLDTATCNVGYLAEERGLYPKYPLMDQLIYFAGLRGVPKAEAKKRIRYWAERLQVEEYLYPGKSVAPAGKGRARAKAQNNNRGMIWVAAIFFTGLLLLYSCFFKASNISMIRSKSSSLLNGMLILPFPLLEYDSCTLALKKFDRCFFSRLYSSGNFALGGFILFFPFPTVSPWLSPFAISSTFLTE